MIFSISNQGVLAINVPNSKILNNYQISLQVFNTKIWGGNNHYLIDVSIQNEFKNYSIISN